MRQSLSSPMPETRRGSPRPRYTALRPPGDTARPPVVERVFLTTQYLEEADQLASRIAVLDQGRLVAQGTPDELKRQVPGGHVRLRFASVHALDAAARVLPGAARDEENLALRVPSDGGVRSLQALLGLLTEHSIDAGELSLHTPDLDEVFLALTGHANTEVNPQ
jgi:ABC-2 type transport system ATP-binding protein